MKKLIIAAIAIGISAASFATTLPAVTKSTISTTAATTVKKSSIFGKHHHKKHHRRTGKAVF